MTRSMRLAPPCQIAPRMKRSLLRGARVVCLRRAVNENFKAENYGVAGLYIQLLLPLNLIDQNEMEKKYATCKSKEMKDSASAPSLLQVGFPAEILKIRFDYKTLKAIEGQASICDSCAASFALNSINGKCPLCNVGAVAAE